MAKKTRLFREQRRFLVTVKRKPVKARHLHWRLHLRLGAEYMAWEWSWHTYGVQHARRMREPDRVTALREVLHLQPGEARAWGECPPSEVLRDILWRARCDIPAGIHVEW